MFLLFSIKDTRGDVKSVKNSPVRWAGIKKEEHFGQGGPCREHGSRVKNGHWCGMEMGIWMSESSSLNSNPITIFSKSLHCSMPQFHGDNNSINLTGL